MTHAEYISDYKMPVRFLALVNEIAASVGVPDIPEQLASDMASVDDGAFCAFAADTTLTKVIANIGKACSVHTLDELDDESFLFVVAESEEDKAFYAESCKRDDVFRARVHEYRVYLTKSTRAMSCRHFVEDMTICDLIAVLAAIKQSQHGKYLLVRYNDNAMMANSFFAGSSYVEGSESSPTGDMWKMFGGLLCELRSVVFDLTDGSIASLPFYKFRNYGECEDYMPDVVAARIENASYVEFTDKMDGSFMQMKFVGADASANYGGDMLVSSSGFIVSEQNEHLREAMKRMDEDIANGRDYIGMCKDNPDTTFMLEFVNPEVDPHIVQYPMDMWGIYLTSARDIKTGHVWTRAQLDDVAKRYDVRITKFFDGMNLNEVLDVCGTAEVFDREGFVANIDGFLVKLKLDQFCDISRLVHGAENFNTIVRIVTSGYLDDLIAKLPVPYRAAIIEDASRMMAFDERMKAYIEHAAAAGGFSADIVGTDKVNMKDAAAYVSNDIDKEFRSTVMNYIKYGKHGGCYLLKKPHLENSSCIKEKDFDRISAKLEALGF